MVAVPCGEEPQPALTSHRAATDVTVITGRASFIEPSFLFQISTSHEIESMARVEKRSSVNDSACLLGLQDGDASYGLTTLVGFRNALKRRTTWQLGEAQRDSRALGVVGRSRPRRRKRRLVRGDYGAQQR